MSDATVPGSVRVRSATLNGKDISNMVREFSVYSSIFKPFRVGNIILFDSINFFNREKLRGNEDFEISFDTGQSGSKIYKAKFKTTSVGNVSDFPSARAQGYKIELADEMYFRNQTVRVQQAYSNITGTDIVKKIFDTYLKGNGNTKLNILKSSKGMIGQNSSKFIRSNEYPLASIYATLKYLYGSGNFCMFQDDDGNVNVGPLDYLIERSQKEIQARFERDPTIGKDSKDFNTISNNIIGLHIPDKHSPALDYMNTKSVRSPVTFAGERHDPSKLKNIQAGKVIGQPLNSEGDNYQSTFERNTSVAAMIDKKQQKNNPFWGALADNRLYANILQNGPSYSMTVTGDSGINVNVGKGIYSNIPAPIGDMNPDTQNQLKGNAMVVNSVKHFKFYDARPQFTCTFDCVRGGVNKT